MLFYFITFSLRCQRFYRIFTKCRLVLRKHGVLCPRSPRFRASCRFTTLPYYYIRAFRLRAFRFRQRISSPHTARYTRQPTPEAAAAESSMGPHLHFSVAKAACPAAGHRYGRATPHRYSMLPLPPAGTVPAASAAVLPDSGAAATGSAAAAPDNTPMWQCRHR